MKKVQKVFLLMLFLIPILFAREKISMREKTIIVDPDGGKSRTECTLSGDNCIVII